MTIATQKSLYRAGGHATSGQRSYSPALGRWLNRDPIGEDGGANLSVFSGNSSINFWDYLGFKWQLTRKSDHSRAPVCRENITDQIDDLANLVGLDKSEAFGTNGWLRDRRGNAVELSEFFWSRGVYTVPNVWISGNLLHGGGIYDRFVNLGGLIGRFIGTDIFTHGFKVVKPDSIPELIKALQEHSGDIWGIVVFGHGSKDGHLTQSDPEIGLPEDFASNAAWFANYKSSRGKTWMYQEDLMTLVDHNGFKLSKLYMMQCYSARRGTVTRITGVDSTDNFTGFRTRVNYNDAWRQRSLEFKGYRGVNALMIDFGR